jgi:hypothetical protein
MDINKKINLKRNHNVSTTMHCLILYENYPDFSMGIKNKIHAHKCFAIYKTWQCFPNTQKCNSIEPKQITPL